MDRNNHNFDKYYYEYLAKVTLEKLFPQAFGELLHGDKPDLLLTDKSYGIEVTRIVYPRNEQREAYFQKNFRDKNVRDVDAKALGRFHKENKVLIVDGMICGRVLDYPSIVSNDRAIEVIIKKVKNTDLACFSCAKLDLYAFSESSGHCDRYEEIKEIADAVISYQCGNGLKFEKLYYDDWKQLYVCNLHNGSIEKYDTENIKTEWCKKACYLVDQL